VDLNVSNVTDRDRYEARDGEQVAGFLEYLETTGAVTVLTHTEVSSEYEGRGVGSTLARHALDDARDRGRRVLPLCPFVAEWLRRHPDYGDVVYEATPSTVSD
jgi:uncharacterized protein